MLSWGHGGHGQLGHYSNQNQKVPTVIEALADERVISIACGGSSSAAITGKNLPFFVRKEVTMLQLSMRKMITCFFGDILVLKHLDLMVIIMLSYLVRSLHVLHLLSSY